MENHTDNNDAASQNDPDRHKQMLHEVLVQHDIPPPIVIIDGSLEIETDANFNESGSGTSWLYERDRSVTGTEIGHIRVLHGNGDMLYQDLHPHAASSVEISVRNKNNPQAEETLTVKGGSAFQILSGRKLGKSDIHGPRRKKRFSHPGPGGAQFRIEKIVVKDGNSNIKFTATRPDDSEAESEEYRVLIWLH